MWEISEWMQSIKISFPLQFHSSSNSNVINNPTIRSCNVWAPTFNYFMIFQLALMELSMPIETERPIRAENILLENICQLIKRTFYEYEQHAIMFKESCSLFSWNKNVHPLIFSNKNCYQILFFCYYFLQ